MTTQISPCAQAARVLLDPDADELTRRRAHSHQSNCPLCASSLDLFDDDDIDDEHDTAAVLERLATVRPYAGMASRVVLGVLATIQGVVSLPWVFGFNPLGSVLGHADNAHLTRDGTLGVLMAVAGLVTAWRPRHAYVMLLVSAAIVAIQFGGGIVDRTGDDVALDFEAVHLVALAIAALIAVNAFRRRNVPPFS